MKKIDYKKIVFYGMVLYILQKNLIDYLTFDISKLLYYPLVGFGALLGMYKLTKKDYGFPLIGVYVIYATYIVLNGLLLSTREQLILGIKEYITFPLVFFAIYYFHNNNIKTVNFFKILTYWGAVTGVLSAWEYIQGASVLPNYNGQIYLFTDGTLAYRSTVFIGAPMLLGLALGTASILSIYFYLQEKKALHLFTFALSFVGIICTSSRGPLVACVAGIVAVYTLLFFQGKISKKFVYTILGLGAIFILIIAVFAFNPKLSTGIEQVDFLIYRISSTFDFRGEWGNAERIKRWTHYLNLFAKQPLFGYGLSTTSAQISSNALVTTHGITTESGVLARLVETGLIGTFLYYAFMLLALSKGIIPLLRVKRLRKAQPINVALIGILTMLFIENVILQITLSLHITFILWLVISFGICIVEQEEDRYHTSFTNQNYKKKFIYRSIKRNYYTKKYDTLMQKNKDCKVAVILHLFYEDSWEEIKEYLLNLFSYDFDLFVSIPNGFVSDDTIEEIKQFKSNTSIIVCENKGFDLGPFFAILNKMNLDNYDIVMKLQSKSTKRPWIYIYNQLFLRRDWFVNLFEGILGSKEVHETIDLLYNNESIGLVASSNLLVNDPLHKEQMILNLAKKYNKVINSNYKFVAGTCFAAKTVALKEMQNMSIQISHFEETSTSRGLSYAHFIERYLCCSISNQGYSFIGNDVMKLRRFLLTPMRKLLYSFSSERLLEQPFDFDPEWFFWQLDNRLIFWKYKYTRIRNLKYTINERLIPFTKCPPYKYLLGDKDIYVKYCKYHKDNGLPVMSTERFDNLKKSIEENGFNESKIIVVNEKNAIMDGQHRACCLCYQYGDTYKVKVLEIRYIDLKSIIKSLLPTRIMQLIYDKRYPSTNHMVIKEIFGDDY